MSIETAEGPGARIHWGSVIPGALCALAIQIVLGLFGAALSFQGGGEGARSLSVVWEVLTPCVALLFGSAMAASMGGRRRAYLNGLLVWCLFLAAVAFYLGRDLDVVTARADAIGLPAASAAALAGFSALIDLAAALVGSSIGKRVTLYELARRPHEHEEEEMEHPAAPVHH